MAMCSIAEQMRKQTMTSTWRQPAEEAHQHVFPRASEAFNETTQQWLAMNGLSAPACTDDVITHREKSCSTCGMSVTFERM